MVRKFLLSLVIMANVESFGQDTIPPTPDRVYGELFIDVQEARIFPDGKTFVDCVPRRDPAEIVKDYLAAKRNPSIKFALDLFVKEKGAMIYLRLLSR